MPFTAIYLWFWILTINLHLCSWLSSVWLHHQNTFLILFPKSFPLLSLSFSLTQFIIPKLKPYTSSSLMALPLQSIMVLKIPHSNIFYTSTSPCPVKYFLTFHHLLFSPVFLIRRDSQVQNNNYVFANRFNYFVSLLLNHSHRSDLGFT